jgi:hypothetical protein
VIRSALSVSADVSIITVSDYFVRELGLLFHILPSACLIKQEKCRLPVGIHGDFVA